MAENISFGKKNYHFMYDMLESNTSLAKFKR